MNETQRKQTAIGSDGYLGKTEMAVRLDRTTRTIEKWMKAGYLPYLKVGRSVLFYWPTVERHLNENYQVTRRPKSLPMRIRKMRRQAADGSGKAIP